MAFVDDQATHRVVQNWSEVAAEFALQRQVLRDWGMEPQLDKCGVMVRWAGRGARERWREGGRSAAAGGLQIEKKAIVGNVNNWVNGKGRVDARDI
jgi:hypothetical protein